MPNDLWIIATPRIVQLSSGNQHTRPIVFFKAWLKDGNMACRCAWNIYLAYGLAALEQGSGRNRFHHPVYRTTISMELLARSKVICSLNAPRNYLCSPLACSGYIWKKFLLQDFHVWRKTILGNGMTSRPDLLFSLCFLAQTWPMYEVSWWK